MQHLLRNQCRALIVAVVAAFVAGTSHVVAAGADTTPALVEGVYARLETDKGVVVCLLEYEKAPLACASFVGLAEGTIESSAKGKPFYNGLTFHRVSDEFMVQTGCPVGDGSGGPGYTFAAEFHPDLRHSGPGILSLVNNGLNLNGSQFIITQVAAPRRNDRHTVFGRVIRGQDIVNSITKGDRLVKVTIQRIGHKAEAYRIGQDLFDRLRKEGDETAERELKDRIAESERIIKIKFPGAKETESGIHYIITYEGKGDPPPIGATVRLHYTGWFLSGERFSSSRLRGGPQEFQAGMGQVPAGWDETVLQMRKGEKRVLVLPPQLAYGATGLFDIRTGEQTIPPHTYLVFDVNLMEIETE